MKLSDTSDGMELISKLQNLLDAGIEDKFFEYCLDEKNADIEQLLVNHKNKFSSSLEKQNLELENEVKTLKKQIGTITRENNNLKTQIQFFWRPQIENLKLSLQNAFDRAKDGGNSLKKLLEEYNGNKKYKTITSIEKTDSTNLFLNEKRNSEDEASSEIRVSQLIVGKQKIPSSFKINIVKQRTPLRELHLFVKPLEVTQLLIVLSNEKDQFRFSLDLKNYISNPQSELSTKLKSEVKKIDGENWSLISFSDIRSEIKLASFFLLSEDKKLVSLKENTEAIDFGFISMGYF